jgi:hypothetical protein
MPDLTAQDIHNLFDSGKMESDTPRKVFLALFADAENDDVLMFLGKIYNSLNDPDNQLD